jgi:hypothetical protein
VERLATLPPSATGKENEMTNDPMRGLCYWVSLALTLLTQTGVVTARPKAAQAARLWQQNLDGTANGFNEAYSVAVDKQGNVVAAGLTQNTGTDFDFTVAKFDR